MNFPLSSKSYGPYYYGAYTLNNRTMTFTDRKSVVTTAINLVNAAIPYPSTFFQIPVCIDYSGSTFDGTITDISNIRCDGFVEYAYEKNDFRVWRNQNALDSKWSIVLYPDLNNDRPDIDRNPEREASPWAQRGAPCATGPKTLLGGCSYFLPDTKMTRPAVIHLPTFQVTTNGGPGYLDVTIRATDESGIHVIGCIKPGEANVTISPTQPQHPTGDSYSWTVRISNSGTLQVAAIDNGGNEGGAVYTVAVVSVAPSAPTAIAATGVTSSVFTANWSSTSGATGYRIDVSTSSTFSSYVSGYQNLDVGNVTSRSVTGLAANTTHYYRVRAYNSGGTSGNSGTITVATLTNPPPAPTANAATSVTGSSFSANWSTTAGATGYRVDVSASSTFDTYVTAYQNLDVGNATSKSVAGLAANTTYYYRVRAYNAGSASGNSGRITVTTLPNPPSAPAANAASGVTSTGFTANWGNATGATSYRLDVSTSSTFSSYVSGYQNLDVGNVMSWSVSGLNANTPYYYRVRASNSGGASGNSITITVTTNLSAPPRIGYASQGGKLLVSWPTNFSGFKLESAASLPVTSWTSNPVSPAIVKGQFTVTNSIDGKQKFYRLTK